MARNEVFERARKASREIANMTGEKINETLEAVAKSIERHSDEIIKANSIDLGRMDPKNPMCDRLRLTKERIEGIVADLRNVIKLPSPLGIVSKERTRPNGLRIYRKSVPLGVIGIIYEARPNVTSDVFSICLKAGNATVLKGGSDAQESNEVIVGAIREALREQGVTEDAVQLMPAGREQTKILLEAKGEVDLIIPRGSRGLIDFVRDNAKVPVIETGAGVVHTYFDKDGDLEKGRKIVNNGKTRRVSVCNALDCLLINKGRLSDLSELVMPMSEKNVVLYADEEAYEQLMKDGIYPKNLIEKAKETHFGMEFQDYKMAVKTVGCVNCAIEHIAKYSSGHSEAIVTENEETWKRFEGRVDAACVYWNAPTSFTDGAQFGLGAEIGISTQKMHARGPMALEEMTTYKWVIEGDGQVRE